MKNEIEDIFPRRLLPISHWQTFDVRLKSLFDNCEVGGDTDLDNWIWAGRKKRSSWTGDDDGQLSSGLSLLIQINSDIGQWKWVKEERFVIHWSQTKNKSIHTHNVPHSTIGLYVHNKWPSGYHGQGKDFRCIWICTQLGSKASCGVESAFYWAVWILWQLATQSIATFTSLRWKNIYK